MRIRLRHTEVEMREGAAVAASAVDVTDVETDHALPDLDSAES